jgi:hypothetical protein
MATSGAILKKHKQLESIFILTPDDRDCPKKKAKSSGIFSYQ